MSNRKQLLRRILIETEIHLMVEILMFLLFHKFQKGKHCIIISLCAKQSSIVLVYSMQLWWTF